MYIYSILTGLKETVNSSAGAIGILLQCFTCLWLQQHKRWSHPKKILSITVLVIERKLEPTVIKKANQFISLKFGDFQLLDINIFLGGSASLGSCLKAYKTSETKEFFPYERFDYPDKMLKTEIPPYDAFYSRLRSCKPVEADHTDYGNLLKSGLTTEPAVVKLKQWRTPPTGI